MPRGRPKTPPVDSVRGTGPSRKNERLLAKKTFSEAVVVVVAAIVVVVAVIVVVVVVVVIVVVVVAAIVVVVVAVYRYADRYKTHQLQNTITKLDSRQGIFACSRLMKTGNVIQSNVMDVCMYVFIHVCVYVM